MFHKQTPPPGSRPGTLAIPAGSPPPRIFLHEYSPQGLRDRECADVEELARDADSGTVTWIDVQGLGDEAVLQRIGEIFALDPLALEDAVNIPQRAKSEVRGDHQVIVARMPIVGADGSVEVPQVCFLLGRRYLLTFQERFFGFFDPVRERIRAGIGPIRTMGPDYLAYALIDTLIDRYYPIVEQLSEQLEELEDAVVAEATTEDLAQLHRIRRQLVILRRIGWPQREAISTLVRDRTAFVSDEVRAFLRDTQDHIAQIMELADSCREMTTGLMEIHMSNLSNRANEIMKVLTLMASIFIPLTFIAGIYGMNFEYMPELAERSAYFVVLGTMSLVAFGMLAYFRWRGWIGSAGRKKRKPRG
jgi:magnesium transporter